MGFDKLNPIYSLCEIRVSILLSLLINIRDREFDLEILFQNYSKVFSLWAISKIADFF